MMKTLVTTALLTGLIASGGSLFAVDWARDLSLEPCINGGVSASGLYASQAEEDAAFAAAESERRAGPEQAAAMTR